MVELKGTVYIEEKISDIRLLKGYFTGLMSVSIADIKSTLESDDDLRDATTSLLEDEFNGIFKSNSSKADKIASLLAGVTALINVDEITPSSIIDLATQEGLDASKVSSSWVLKDNVSNEITAMQAKCPTLGKKNPIAMLDDMMSGILKKSDDALQKDLSAFKNKIGDLFDLVKLPSFNLNLPELEIGKYLHDIMKKIKKSFDSTDLDKLIDCVDTIGGAAAAANGTTDSLIDQTNDYYNKVYAIDDPEDLNFGELDVGSYLDDVPGISGEQKNNILKTTNMHKTAEDQTNDAVKQASDSLKISGKSSTADVISTPPAAKTQYIAENSKTKFTTPAKYGEPEKIEEIPEPEPAEPKNLTKEPPEPLPEMVPISKFVAETIFKHEDSNTNLINSSTGENYPYTHFDPGVAQESRYIDAALNKISKIKVIDPKNPSTLEINVILQNFENT